MMTMSVSVELLVVQQQRNRCYCCCVYPYLDHDQRFFDDLLLLHDVHNDVVVVQRKLVLWVVILVLAMDS